MSNKIKLNNEISVDLEKLISGKMLLQANTGGGKSWAIRRIVEQSFGTVPIIILDTEGEFSSLRQKYDFILIGKGHEVAADPKTAALLAHKLIEERVSAIIDLFEMTPYDRAMFVKNFVSAMTNAPKTLWLTTLLVIDEAQTYAPEGDKTECGQVLHDAAFKFRKRHFGIIFATPRIAVLSKNVSSTCRNKLIGYTSEPNDVKRAAYELGFTSKDEWRSLRDLDPGEFFVFGPAISKEVIKVKLGNLVTPHGDQGNNTKIKVAPASSKVKKALAVLADLQQEAAKELLTITDLKTEVSRLRRELTIAQKAPDSKKDIEGATKPLLSQIAGLERIISAQKKDLESWWKWSDGLLSGRPQKFDHKLFGKTAEIEVVVQRAPIFEDPKPTNYYRDKPYHDPGPIERPIKAQSFSTSNGGITGPEQRILDAIAWLNSIGIEEPEQVAVAFLADYKYGGGGFNNPKGALRTKGLIEYVSGNRIKLTPEGEDTARAPDRALTQEALHAKVLNRLPGPEQKLLRPLLENGGADVSKEELAEISGYKFGTGGFNNPCGRLRTLGLVEYPSSGRVKARSILFI